VREVGWLGLGLGAGEVGGALGGPLGGAPDVTLSVGAVSPPRHSTVAVRYTATTTTAANPIDRVFDGAIPAMEPMIAHIREGGDRRQCVRQSDFAVTEGSTRPAYGGFALG
jgi:hypothetical protein